VCVGGAERGRVAKPATAVHSHRHCTARRGIGEAEKAARRARREGAACRQVRGDGVAAVSGARGEKVRRTRTAGCWTSGTLFFLGGGGTVWKRGNRRSGRRTAHKPRYHRGAVEQLSLFSYSYWLCVPRRGTCDVRPGFAPCLLAKPSASWCFFSRLRVEVVVILCDI